MRYSNEPRDRIYIKCYGFLPYAKNLSSKYAQKHLEPTKKSVTDALKTASKRAIHKMAEAPGDLVENKIADKITKSAHKDQIKSKAPTQTHTNRRNSIIRNSKTHIPLEKLRRVG